MRKILKVIIAIMIVILCIKGYVYVQDQKWLSTHDVLLDYGYYSLADIVQQSERIVEGTVLKVKDVTVKRVLNIYRDHEGKLRYNIEKYPVTPIKIKVNQVIKGKTLTKTVTYYKEYSNTTDDEALPNGPVVKVGMEFLVALDKRGFCPGGGQGLWLVFDDKVKVSEGDRIMKYVDESTVVTIDADDIENKAWDLRGRREFLVIEMEQVVSVLQSFGN